MNRRNFLSSLAKGIVAFTVLPPATTYDRIWKATIPDINTAWNSAEYEVAFLFSSQELINIGNPPRVLDMPIGKAPFRLYSRAIC